MVLHTERRQRPMLQSFDSVVVEVHVRHFDVVQIQAVRIDGESMILSRDLDLVALQVHDWMISAVMSEFQLEGSSAKRQSQNLVAEADSKHRLLSEKLPDVLDCVIDRLGIPRAIGK